MDPFSLTIGIAGLVGLTVQTIKAANSYISASREATESAAALVTELKAVESNLTHLDAFLRTEAVKGGNFEHTSALQSTSSGFERKLKALCDKLEGVGNSRTKRLLWPLNRDEHIKAIQDLRAFASWIHFGLSLDGSALLSRTSDDVLKILEQQIETIKALQITDSQNTDLREAIEDQSAILQRSELKDKRKKIIEWISPLDFTSKHNAVRFPRVEGTGSWFIDQPEYIEWRDSPSASNILWCHGIQGSGKSVIVSLVVDQLQKHFNDSDRPLAFVYFDYRESQKLTTASVISSILRQLVAATPDVPTDVQFIYERMRSAEQRLPLHDLLSLLISVARPLGTVYILIDALDECQQALRGGILKAVDQLRVNTNIKLFLTSRSHAQDIRNSMAASTQIEIVAQDSDLRQYMDHEIQETCDASVIDQELASVVIEKLIKNSNGLFLLAVLQLRSVLEEPTAGDMEDALERLSQNLPDAFAETIIRIQQLPIGRKRLANKTLLWTGFASRLFRVDELVEALSIKPGQRAPNSKYRPSLSLVLECCQGLVTVDPGTDMVRFAHYSIQEYLVGQTDSMFPNADDEIAETCLTYLLFDKLKEGPCETRKAVRERLTEHPLLAFAAIYGCVHARGAQPGSSSITLSQDLLEQHGAIASCLQIGRYSGGYRELYWSAKENLSHTPLHFAAYFGMHDNLRDLLRENKEIVNSRTTIGATALILAASRGHSEATALLLVSGADPELQNWYGNALHCAAEAGCLSTIDQLLRHGVDLNAFRECGLNALHCTVDNDQADAADALISGGADVDARTPKGFSVFHLAVACGRRNLVELLLSKPQVDINSTVHRQGYTPTDTALSLALANHDKWMVKKLCDAGAKTSSLVANCDSPQIANILKHTRANRKNNYN